MLFDSSVRRELWRSFSGTLVVLLTVLLTMVLIRILSQATKGALDETTELVTDVEEQKPLATAARA